MLKYVRILVGVLFVMLLSLFSTGCYLLSQSGTYLSDRIQAKSIDKLMEDRDTPEDTKLFLSDVYDIIDFAMNDLGLAESKNYTKYVELDRKHLAYIIYASDELAFNQYMWKFPIVGELPYQGYFKLESARKEEVKFKEQGYDTFVSVVDGFSSLGFFTDPLYSFMKQYSLYRLANLIIHEQTHATIWVKGYTTFNERLASFVGDIGAKLYIAKRFGEDSEEFGHIFNLEKDRALFLEKMGGLRSELNSVYEDDSLSDDEKRERKRSVITSFQEDLRAGYEDDFITSTYSYIPDMTLNNAYIGLYHVYYGDDTYFDDLYASYGEDLRRMIELLKPLDKTKSDPYTAIDSIDADSF